MVAGSCKLVELEIQVFFTGCLAYVQTNFSSGLTQTGHLKIILQIFKVNYKMPVQTEHATTEFCFTSALYIVYNI